MEKNTMLDKNESDSELSVVSQTNFESYLKSLGLPSEHIIASPSEKNKLQKNLPDAILQIPSSDRKNAVYLSRFVASSAIGLYDASLNYLWNEVIKKIREKVIVYGLDIFFDQAVGDNVRELYKDEKDLPAIKDVVLLDTCLKLEIISPVVHTKLRYILDMRNNIGASHPNDEIIGTYELLGDLEICVNKVLNDNPSSSAIEVKKFISNLRSKDDTFDKRTLLSIGETFKSLPTSLCGTLLKTMFGMYTDLKIPKITKENILKIAPIIWQYSDDTIKYDIGNKQEVFLQNLESEKTTLGESFLTACNGMNYKPNSRKSIELTSLIEELNTAHINYDNFYHEVPIAQKIMSYLKTSNDIPKDRAYRLIETILRCSLGKPFINYCEGVSEGAKKYYYAFFSLLDTAQIKLTLKVIIENSSTLSLDASNCRKHFIEIIRILDTPIVTDRIREIFDYLQSSEEPKDILKKLSSKKFKLLYKPLE